MSALHYGFPPASAYRLNRCLFAIKSDAAFRARYVTDPAAAMLDMGLDDDERSALSAGDRDRLFGLGLILTWCSWPDLRLRMEKGTATFEYF